MRATIINLVYRMKGFYVAPGNPKQISRWTDLCRNDVRFVNRERGSGPIDIPVSVHFQLKFRRQRHATRHAGKPAFHQLAGHEHIWRQF